MTRTCGCAGRAARPVARSPLAQVGVLHVGGALNEHDGDDGNRDARNYDRVAEIKRAYDPEGRFRPLSTRDS